MEPRTSPALLRRRIGNRLRELRKEMDLNMVSAAGLVDRTQGWLSKMEAGHPSISAASVRLLLMGYGRRKEEVDEWARLTKAAGEQGWWESEGYKEVVLEDFADYLGAESAVTRMSYFEVQLVPGIAQTPEYARVLMHAHLSQEFLCEIDAYVALRMARQERLFVDDGPQVRLVLDDPVIHRVIGSVTIMKAQLAHLLTLAKRRTIDLRVLPLSAGAEAAVGTPFIYLEFYGDPDFAYVESLTSGHYARDPAEVQRHRITFERLQRAALSQKASAEVIQKAMEDLK